MRATLLMALATAVVAVALFGSTLTGGAFAFDASHSADVYTLSALYERFGHYIGEGEYPWYFPEFGCGSPLPAGWMYGLFSPATLLFAVIPPGAAWSWSAVLHLVLAAVGMFLFTRGIGMRPAAAAVGGFIYAFSEFMVGRAVCGHLNLVWPAAWMPLAFFALHRVIQGKPRSVPLLGLILGLGSISGHVQVWFYFAPVLVAYGLIELRRSPEMKRRLGAVLAGVLLALGLAAVQVTLTGEYYLTVGETDLPHLHHPAFTTPPTVLAEKLFPGFLGRPPEEWRGGPVLFHESFAVGGLGILLLAAMGLVDPRKGRWLFLGALLLGVAFAFGGRNPVSALLNSLPLFSSGRACGRALILPVFAVAVLAARGADAWLLPESRFTRRRLAIACGLVAVLAGTGLAYLALHQEDPGDFTAGLPAVLRSVVSLAVLCGGLFLTTRFPKAAWVLPAAALTAIFMAGLPPVRPVEDDFYRRDPTIDYPETALASRVFVAGWGSIPVLEQHGIRTTRPALPVDTSWFEYFMRSGSPYMHRWLDVGLHIEMVNARDFLREVDPLRPTITALLTAPGPSMFFRSAIGNVGDREAIARLSEGEGELLFPGEPPPLPPIGERVGTDPREGESPPAETGPGWLRLKTRHVGSGWLYVTEKYYPTWRATLDGKELEIYRAAVTGMAVAIPGGEHEVEFRYAPRAAAFGPPLSLAFLALIALLLLRPRRKNNTGSPF